MDVIAILLSFLYLLFSCKGQSPASWEDVWGYHKLQGPDAWGDLHSAWKMCKEGKRQSPINIEADSLLFDPNLSRVELSAPETIYGNYTNTGRAIVFMPASIFTVLIWNGPLNYKYHLHEIRLHFGEDNYRGSEHTIEGSSFQGELHMTFWNQDIYSNFDEARDSPNGLAAIALFIQLNSTTSSELNKLTETAAVGRLVYKKSTINVTNLRIGELFPNTRAYLTYEGSISIPPCSETVTWILINRPLYITSYQLNGLRELLQTKREDPHQERLFHNFRSTQPRNSRSVRTNIAHGYDIHKKCNQSRREYEYSVNMFSRFL